MQTKILIIGSDKSPKEEVAKSLCAVNDRLQIAPVFTTDLRMRDKKQDGSQYYMPNEEVELSYKNNAFMWVWTDSKISRGVTMPDMYSYNIFTLTFNEFNNISNPVLKEIDSSSDLILVVLDEGLTKKDNICIREANNAFERIYEHHYLYFLDERVQDIVECILKYIVSSEEEREAIEETLNE